MSTAMPLLRLSRARRARPLPVLPAARRRHASPCRSRAPTSTAAVAGTTRGDRPAGHGRGAPRAARGRLRQCARGRARRLRACVVGLNGEPLVELPLVATQGTISADIDIPARLLAAGVNTLSLRARQHHRVGCDRAAFSELWTRLDPAGSYLELDLAPRARHDHAAPSRGAARLLALRRRGRSRSRPARALDDARGARMGRHGGRGRGAAPRPAPARDPPRPARRGVGDGCRHGRLERAARPELRRDRHLRRARRRAAAGPARGGRRRADRGPAAARGSAAFRGGAERQHRSGGRPGARGLPQQRRALAGRAGAGAARRRGSAAAGCRRRRHDRRRRRADARRARLRDPRSAAELHRDPRGRARSRRRLLRRQRPAARARRSTTPMAPASRRPRP